MEALGGRQARRGFAYEAYLPAKIGDESFLLESDIAAAAANAELACRELNEDPPELANSRPWLGSCCELSRSLPRASRA